MGAYYSVTICFGKKTDTEQPRVREVPQIVLERKTKPYSIPPLPVQRQQSVSRRGASARGRCEDRAVAEAWGAPTVIPTHPSIHTPPEHYSGIHA